MRAVLYMGALVASRHNPAIRDFYQRLLVSRKNGAGRVHAQTAGYTQRHAQSWLSVVRYDSASRRSFLLTFKTVAIGCSLFLVGLLFHKPLSQKHRSTFLPLQPAATLIFSVDWA